MINPPLNSTSHPWRLCVAPMMDWSDRHFRHLCRLISRHTWLYTEMVTTGALLHGDLERHLAFHPDEHPVALQLGGSVPAALMACARIGAERGYDEINLNVGCPSDRVQNNRIGACLMDSPGLVAECLSAMRSAVQIPVTIKHRLGIDDMESEQFLQDFVGKLADCGTEVFIVHARIARLQGLSPKQNREIPPLRYEWVYRLKQVFPDRRIILNGGIQTLDEAMLHLRHVDGVMIGRAAYQNPWILAEADKRVFARSARRDSTRSDGNDDGCGDGNDNDNGDEEHTAAAALADRFAIAVRWLRYLRTEHAAGTPLWAMVRHALGLFHGVPGGRAYRRHLSTHALRRDATPDVYATAVDLVARQAQH